MATLNIEIDVPIPTGNTLWVDAVNGDDATGVSGRQDRPFLTIQSAISQASAPSTIRIRPGSYQGPIVLKNGVDIECDLGVSITAEINVINTYTISDGGVAVVCSITGKPKVFLIEGSAPPAGACLHLSNSASSIFVDIESLVGDTSDTDMGIFLEGGRITGSIGSITTTTYDGIWLAAQNCSVNLEIGSISAGDNPIEVTACSASEIRAGYLSGNGINIVAGNGEDVDVCIVSQRCVMFGQSILSTVNGGSVKAFLSLGQYDAGGGIGFQGLCDGAVISETRIFNSTIPIELSGGVGYQFDGGLVLGCVLVGSGDSIGASTPVSVLSRGSSANTAVGTSVTVEGDLFYDDGADPSGKVSTGNADGTWSWAAQTGGGAVDSVNGETGVVVLDAGDVGADPAGSAASAQAAAIAAAATDATTKANSAQAASQPLDADLTAIAGLTPANDDVIQRKAGSWVNRTMAQLWADLKSLADLVYAPLAPPSFITYTGGSVATTSTSFANVHASASLAVPAAGFYEFQFLITYQSAATTTGARFGINGTMANTYLAGVCSYSAALGDRGASPIRDYDAGGAVASSFAASADIPAVLTGFAQFSGAGTLSLRFATGVGGSAITVTALTGFLRKQN